MRRMNPKCLFLTHRSWLVTIFKVNTIHKINIADVFDVLLCCCCCVFLFLFLFLLFLFWSHFICPTIWIPTPNDRSSYDSIHIIIHFVTILHQSQIVFAITLHFNCGIKAYIKRNACVYAISINYGNSMVTNCIIDNREKKIVNIFI